MVVAQPPKLQKFADAVAERTDDGASGDPLTAVSQTRALRGATRAEQLGGVPPNDVPWSDSSFGRAVDLCAPSSPLRRATTTPRGKFEYGHGAGTSYPTPPGASTAALWQVKHRGELDAQNPESWKRVAAFKKILLENVGPSDGWPNERYGKGILDARAALDATLPDSDALERDKLPH